MCRSSYCGSIIPVCQKNPSIFHSFTSVEVFSDSLNVPPSFFPTGVLEPLPLGQNDSGSRPRRPRRAPPRGLQPLGRREEAGGRPAAQRQLPLRTHSQRLPGEEPQDGGEGVEPSGDPGGNRPCSSRSSCAYDSITTLPCRTWTARWGVCWPPWTSWDWPRAPWWCSPPTTVSTNR